ncbi:MAG: YihY/virulence factor BrkB family protein [Thermodesulfovibrionales bacterium]
MRNFRIIFSSFVDFYRDNGLTNAAAISYFSVMAIVPFCLLIITIFGYVLGHDERLLVFFTERLSHFFPRITHDIVDELKKIITYRGIGRLTLLIYIILSYQLFSSIESAVNVIFKSKVRRAFLVSLLISIFIISLVCILIVLSFVASTAISLLQLFKDYFPGLKIGIVISFLIRYVIPFILLFLTMIALYLFLPRAKVRIRPVVLGALFASVMFEVAKHIFTIYVVRVAKLGTIYGPISALVIFLLWVFYSSSIFLIGAELVNKLNKIRQ